VKAKGVAIGAGVVIDDGVKIGKSSVIDSGYHFGTDFYQLLFECPQRPVPYLVWQSQTPKRIAETVSRT
jgi:tetrahydrodipicolinate N-succinyltransferase